MNSKSTVYAAKKAIALLERVSENNKPQKNAALIDEAQFILFVALRDIDEEIEKLRTEWEEEHGH